MAVVPWHVDLPQVPQKDFQETVGINIIRTSMDMGPSKQRVRSKRPSTLQLNFIMTKIQTERLESFIITDLAGVKRFSWKHPRTGSNIECRIVPQGDGEFYTLSYLAPDYYQVNLKFEILP